MKTLNESEAHEVVGGMIADPFVPDVGFVTDTITTMIRRWLYYELFGTPGA